MGQGGGGELIGMVQVDYRGAGHVLGRTADAYAIWDIQGGPPRQTFPLSDEGWVQAWETYQRLEAAGWAAPATGPSTLGGPPAPQAAGPATAWEGRRTST